MGLQKLIHEATMSGNGKSVKNIDALISRIKSECPESLHIVKRAISEFIPQVIVNKIDDEQTALGPVKRIQEVSRKKLSIDVGYLCSLPFQDGVEKSARTLVPWLSQASNDIFTQKIDGVTARLMDTRFREN